MLRVNRSSGPYATRRNHSKQHAWAREYYRKKGPELRFTIDIRLCLIRGLSSEELVQMKRTNTISLCDGSQRHYYPRSSKLRRSPCTVGNRIPRIISITISKPWRCMQATKLLFAEYFQAVWDRWQSDGIISWSWRRLRVSINYKNPSGQDSSPMRSNRSKPTLFGQCKSNQRKLYECIRCAIGNALIL